MGELLVQLLQTYPCSCPDIRAEVEDWQLQHEIDARDELYRPANSIDGAPGQVQGMADPAISAKFQACKADRN